MGYQTPIAPCTHWWTIRPTRSAPLTALFATLPPFSPPETVKSESKQ